MKELKPISKPTRVYEAIERRIKELFKQKLYLPILRESEPVSPIGSMGSPLAKSIQSGRVFYQGGLFKGKFNADISKELVSLGAQWDPRRSAWRIPIADIPFNIRSAISAYEVRFSDQTKKIDSLLSKILPEDLAEHLRVEGLFDKALRQTEAEFQKSIKKITVAPELTANERKRLASEWQFNMKLWIKDFTEKEIASLRSQVQKLAFSGGRHESLISTIQKSYGVSENKAKFLARQETNLLISKFKETRYSSAGIKEYKWTCVTGTKNHPVRPSHKALEGKTFLWENPPVTSEPGETTRRNNPGQDFNCRCVARPIVRFNKKQEVNEPQS